MYDVVFEMLSITKETVVKKGPLSHANSKCQLRKKTAGKQKVFVTRGHKPYEKIHLQCRNSDRDRESSIEAAAENRRNSFLFDLSLFFSIFTFLYHHFFMQYVYKVFFYLCLFSSLFARYI